MGLVETAAAGAVGVRRTWRGGAAGKIRNSKFEKSESGWAKIFPKMNKFRGLQ
jgi:hypothetical protein